MQQLYETVLREQEWIEAGCPKPAPQPPCEIDEAELDKIFGKSKWS